MTGDSVIVTVTAMIPSPRTYMLNASLLLRSGPPSSGLRDALIGCRGLGFRKKGPGFRFQ